MGKKLTSLSWEELQTEMSIAGNPEKFAQLGKQIESLLFPSIHATNRAEMINAELMLRRLMAELKLIQRMYDRSH